MSLYIVVHHVSDTQHVTLSAAVCGFIHNVFVTMIILFIPGYLIIQTDPAK